jgi:hypothetical protein
MSERSLVSYLLLPRPGDLIKAWIFPAAFALGVLADGGASGPEIARAALVWAALELLIYQSRYQWNDIRGFEADQRHPDCAGRGRLPGPPGRGRRHITASATVAAGRLGLLVVFAAAPPLRLGWALLGLALAVFAIAALYEFLRSRATGRSDRVPPRPTSAILAVWAVVGGGYAIRGVSGLAFAIPLAHRPELSLLAAVAFWAFGVAFVTSRWALEALSFAHLDGRGRLAWRVAPGQAREHTLALARWLPAPGAEAMVSGREGSLADWRPLAGSVSTFAPWNLATFLATAAAAPAGCLLCDAAGPLSVAVAAAVGAALVSPVLMASGRHRLAWAWSAAAVAILLATETSPRPLLAVLPWLLVLATHLFCTTQCLRTLPHPVRSGAEEAKRRLGSAAPRRQRVPLAVRARR